MRSTPEEITKLKPNEIFVFGSNAEGNHAGGAAKTAVDKFGAIMGQGEGSQGQSYAIPTMQGLEPLKESVSVFLTYAASHAELTFLVTRLGTGIAGLPEDEVKVLFAAVPSNVRLPKGWDAAESVTLGYKAFTADWDCRNGMHYEVGQTYEHDGPVLLCYSGFHFCENPLDILNYYDLTTAKFAVVEASGVAPERKDDSKRVAKRLHVKAALDLSAFVKASVEFVWKAVNQREGTAAVADDRNYAQLAASGDYAKQAASGDYAQLAASGNYAKQAASGDYAKQAASGDGAKQAASGDDAKLTASGDGAQQAASGDYAQLAASGNYAKQAASGDGAKQAASGDYAQLAASGNYAQLAASGNGAQQAASGDYAQQAASGDGAKQAASGDGAKQAASGDYAQLAASGNGAQQAASGDYAQLAASGDGAKQAASGDGAKQAASGDDAQLAASGNYAKLTASGDYAQLAASGQDSIVAGIGQDSMAKAEAGSWIVLAEWRDYKPVSVVSVQVDGEKVKADTYYRLVGGELVEVQS